MSELGQSRRSAPAPITSDLSPLTDILRVVGMSQTCHETTYATFDNRLKPSTPRTSPNFRMGTIWPVQSPKSRAFPKPNAAQHRRRI
jgi:hypothetical protein